MVDGKRFYVVCGTTSQKKTFPMLLTSLIKPATKNILDLHLGVALTQKSSKNYKYIWYRDQSDPGVKVGYIKISNIFIKRGIKMRLDLECSLKICHK